MAFSATYQIHNDRKLAYEKNCSKVKRYGSADPCFWATTDAAKKSNALRDILACPNHEINTLVEEIEKNDKELDKIHNSYDTNSEKLRVLDENIQDSNKFSSKTDENQKKNFEEIIKERDDLKLELGKLEDLMSRCKMRADKADAMEQEINQLKNDLQKCGHGGSGDKLNVVPARVKSDSQCNKCSEYVAELKESRSMLELKDRKLIELQSQKNFLTQRAEIIRCMEAELILYKMKYEEYECKMLNLKEIVVKAEINEKKLRDSICKLKTIECQLQESEQENECLIGKIEQMDIDLKERDVYIECLNKRLQKDNSCTPQKAIQCAEVTPGMVQTMIKRMSKEPLKPSTCKCNIENCHCATVSKCPCTASKESNIDVENIIQNECYISNTSAHLIQQDSITMSEVERLQEEISSDEIKLLRQQNKELDKEIRRLKEQLAGAHKVVEDIEKERSSNCNLESEVNELKIRHTQELENVNTNFRTSICQKMSEIQSMEQKLVTQIQQKCELENKLVELIEKLKEMESYCCKYQELNKSFESLQACHEERLKEMECLKCECVKSREENCRMAKTIDLLRDDLEEQKSVNKRHQCERNASKDQRNMIKKSVEELKKFHDEKALIIKSYEKKIRALEAENECLKHGTSDNNVSFSCDDILFKKLSAFGIDLLNDEELTELHDRVRCAMMKLTKKDSHIDMQINYSKMIEELCKRYNITSSKELIFDNLPVRDNRDSCSTISYPNVRRTVTRKVCKKRSKSSEMTKQKCN